MYEIEDVLVLYFDKRVVSYLMLTFQRGGMYMGKNMSLSAKECLEFSKKIAVLQKISRLGLVSDSEYILVKNRIFDEYRVDKSYFPEDVRIA